MMPYVFKVPEAIDPDCVHCRMAIVLHEFLQEHPHKESVHVVAELCQLLGEFTAAHGDEFRERLGPDYGMQIIDKLNDELSVYAALVSEGPP